MADIKNVDKIANIVDHYQIAPSVSSLKWVYTDCLKI